MLSKRIRLTKELFNEVMDSGKIFHSSILSLKAIKVNRSDKKDFLKNRFAVVASKNYFKTAVLRNKIRRRTYAALADVISPIKNTDNRAFYCIFMMKPPVLKLNQSDLKEAIHQIFVKSRIIT